MEKKLRIVPILTIVLFIGNALALTEKATSINYEKYSQTIYLPNEKSVFTINLERSYDNKNRYSTYEYSNGYTYRETSEYWINKALNDIIISLKNTNSKPIQAEKNYYEKYIPHLRKTQKITCYKSPPENKLFYIKCPN